MKKCILMPDSFKGTMSSFEVSQIMKGVIVDKYPNCQVIAIPVADGGEGTVDCFLKALGGEKISLKTMGPFSDMCVESFYGICNDVGIVEMAASAGLPLAFNRLDPFTATTYGVGQLVGEAVSRGCNKVILGLGGSSTNDAGCGMAAALGTKFLDETGKSFLPTGGTLSKVAHIDVEETNALLKNIEIIAMCDIDNPLYGRNGAAYIFAPQKGASPRDVALLDENLQIFADVIKKELGTDITDLKGGGAAGGAGAGAKVFLNAKLKQGIETVLDLVNFEHMLKDCDCVFTGEGKLDDQSLSGKVVSGIGKRAKKLNVPVFAVVGNFEGSKEMLKDYGISNVFITKPKDRKDEEILKYAKIDLQDTMKVAVNSI